jgi:hypothetical protein
MRKLLALLVILTLVLGLWGCQSQESEGTRFKSEYEQLNGQKDEDGNVLCELTLPADGKIIYAEPEKICEAFENGTHVIYLGWPQCNWCRRMLPVLLDTVRDYPGVYIYYYNLKSARQAFESGGNDKLAQVYRDIVSELEKDDYDFTELVSYYEDGTMKIPSSLVYFIREGEIIGVHRRTVASHLDAFEPLDDGQKKELAEIYRTYLEEMVRKVAPGCDDC